MLISGMKVEYLVYFYLAVCLSIILFNIATIIVSRLRKRWTREREIKYTLLLGSELARLQEGLPVEKKRLLQLKRSLRSVEELLVFVQVMIRKYEEAPEDIRHCLERFISVLDSLAPYYEKQGDPIRYSFFLYTIKEFGAMSGVIPPRVEVILLQAVQSTNPYCRENALEAIYASGRSDLVIQALRMIDALDIPHNSKLLSDGLVSFRGDKEELSDRLWEIFDRLSLPRQQVILDFMRFGSRGQRDHIFPILVDEKRHPELRFSCIRYFARYPDQEAYPVLLELARGTGQERWEYAAIACAALASYPGEETVETLKQALHVRSWYVRYNAAESLSRLGVGYLDLIEVLEGNDRYAREILQYQMDMKDNQRREVSAG